MPDDDTPVEEPGQGQTRDDLSVESIDGEEPLIDEENEDGEDGQATETPDPSPRNDPVPPADE